MSPRRATNTPKMTASAREAAAMYGRLKNPSKPAPRRPRRKGPKVPEGQLDVFGGEATVESGAKAWREKYADAFAPTEPLDSRLVARELAQLPQEDGDRWAPTEPVDERLVARELVQMSDTDEEYLEEDEMTPEERLELCDAMLALADRMEAGGFRTLGEMMEAEGGGPE